MVAIAVASVVVAVAVPGYRVCPIIFGGVLVAWAAFGVAYRGVARVVPGSKWKGRHRRRCRPMSIVHCR